MAVANRIEAFDVTVPAGTAKASPQLTDVSFPDGQLQWVELDVPPGHNGVTGFQLLSAKGQMIPYTFGEFLVANDLERHWDLVGQIDTGSFQVNAYNTGLYSHTFHIRFGVLDFAFLATPEPAAPLTPPPVLV